MVNTTPASPLSSPSIGTATTDLIRPCLAPYPRAAIPSAPNDGPAVAVALSGGGFRASLAGLGVLRFLADARLLGNARYVSAVSGGSVASGVFALAYGTLQARGFTGEAFDELVLGPFVQRVSSSALSQELILRAVAGLFRKTRTEALADALDRRFFHGAELTSLPAQCRFIFNAANAATGVRFGFERDVMGDYVMGNVSTAGAKVRLATAVAASAAVPGLLAPMTLEGVTFPCQEGRTVRLLDGGAYDNMGLEPLDGLHDAMLVAINAGGQFVTGRYGRIPILRNLQLADSMLYRQSTALRRRWMVERFRAWEEARTQGVPAPEWARRGVLFGLATTLPPTPEWAARNPTPPTPAEVALVGTSFGRFDREVCTKLVYAGWWLAGATLSKYQPEVLGTSPLPQWRDLP